MMQKALTNCSMFLVASFDGTTFASLVKYYLLILTESKMSSLNEQVQPVNVQILLLVMKGGNNLVLSQFVNSNVHIFDIIKYISLAKICTGDELKNAEGLALNKCVDEFTTFSIANDRNSRYNSTPSTPASSVHITFIFY